MAPTSFNKKCPLSGRAVTAVFSAVFTEILIEVLVEIFEASIVPSTLTHVE